MIRIDSLSHTYPRQKEPALDSFSLELAEGAITGFIGPNGSGKTTLFKALAGRILPSSGQVLIDGRPAGTHRPLPLRRRRQRPLPRLGEERTSLREMPSDLGRSDLHSSRPAIRALP